MATGFWHLASHIPGASFSVVYFSTDELWGPVCPFYTDTGGKILRLRVAEKQIRDKSRHSKRDIRLGRVECRLTFCFSATCNLYTDFFQQCLYIKDTPFPLYSFGKIYFIENKESLGI